MIHVKELPRLIALDIVFKTSHYPFIKDMIIDSDEVFSEGKHWFLNPEKRNRIYTSTNSKKFIWLGIFNDDDLIGLQFIDNNPTYVELIVAEKKPHTKEKIFSAITEYVKKRFDKDIITFPLTDKLKEHYKQAGFIDYKNDYLILQV